MNSYLNEIISASLRVNYRQYRCVNECHFTHLLIEIVGMINSNTTPKMDNQNENFESYKEKYKYPKIYQKKCTWVSPSWLVNDTITKKKNYKK